MGKEYDWDKINKVASKRKIGLAKSWLQIENEDGQPYFDTDWITKKVLKLSNEDLRQMIADERKKKINKIINNGKFK